MRSMIHFCFVASLLDLSTARKFNPDRISKRKTPEFMKLCRLSAGVIAFMLLHLELVRGFLTKVCSIHSPVLWENPLANLTIPVHSSPVMFYLFLSLNIHAFLSILSHLLWRKKLFFK